jgi:type IV secretory pathway TraG/TraD family ATPase VirD4
MGGSTGDEAAWVIPGVVIAIAAIGGALELGGAAASAFSGHGVRFAPFTMASAVAIARHGTTALWPSTSPSLVAALAAVAAVSILGPAGTFAVRAWLRRPPADSPSRSLAQLADVRALTRFSVVRRAQQLRPSLAGRKPKDVPLIEVGIHLGNLAPAGNVALYGSWEDVALALMAPRSMKTTALSVPLVLDAPGPVIATANKSDLWAATSALREASTGARVWAFDPQRIARVPQTWWWNPLRDIAEGESPVEEAERLAGHFVLTIEDSRSRDIWGPAARGLLAALLLAAAAGDRTIGDVYRWLASDGSPVPVELLREHGWEQVAAALAGLYADPPETRGSVYFTARVAARCLNNPQITAWVMPPHRWDLEEFRPSRLPGTRETLYLMSKDGGGSSAPLVAALTDAVMRAGVVAAERRGGRLDAPMVVVLDEAANICRIADLPRLYSHLGSRGVVVLTILQSYHQGVGVWGDTGMKELWSAATIKLVGAGIDDANFAEDVSRLIGDHDVATTSRNLGGQRSTRTVSSRQQRVLPPSAIRALPRGHALLIATGVKVAMLKLQPWFTGPRRAEIAAATAEAVATITAAAASSAGIANERTDVR